jgi:Na+/melibiose symporter-like transporter
MNAAPWRYGLLGLPLAFVALPLYVSLPAHYAREHGLPLALLGALLLGARCVDALADPWIGRQADRWLRPGAWARVLLPAAGVMAASFAGLFMAPALPQPALLVWAGVLLVLGYLAYSVLAVSHQAWGARLGGNVLQQTRLVAWREGLGLLGVLAATLMMSQAGWAWTSGLLALALFFGLLALRGLALPAPPLGFHRPWHLAWQQPAFRRLLLIYAVNGTAAAIPATLLLFFVRDRLQAPQWEAAFLLSYFACAAAAMPLWLRAVQRWGQARSWALGMALAIAVFVAAAGLGEGDVAAFLLICALTGVAAGADLALPGAMLTRVVQNAGLSGQAEGSFLGWWTATTKLNLALAAGLALPLLQALGYREGARDAASLQALSLCYAALPCLLKALALGLLWRHKESL